MREGVSVSVSEDSDATDMSGARQNGALEDTGGKDGTSTGIASLEPLLGLHRGSGPGLGWGGGCERAEHTANTASANAVDGVGQPEGFGACGGGGGLSLEGFGNAKVGGKGGGEVGGREVETHSDVGAERIGEWWVGGTESGGSVG